eukprot:COSAG02_NODE_64777_length_259_cov_1.275000_1_plen_42_part_10
MLSPILCVTLYLMCVLASSRQAATQWRAREVSNSYRHDEDIL